MNHTGGHYFQAGVFKSGVDLSDDVLGHCIRLDNRQGALGAHLKNSNKIKGLRNLKGIFDNLQF
jgi:hypothetical protein